jgi:hypothetical protein
MSHGFASKCLPFLDPAFFLPNHAAILDEDKAGVYSVEPVGAGKSSLEDAAKGPGESFIAQRELFLEQGVT